MKRISLILVVLLFFSTVSCANSDAGENQNEVSENIINESEGIIMNSELSFQTNAVVDSSTIDGKVLCGYQGWFGTPSDGYSERGWMHWSGSTPSMNKDGKQSVSFEMFPDLSEYNPSKLAKIKFPDLPDGTPAALFSSFDEETIDLHFKWMQEYGIDGVALQRFIGEALGGRSRHVNTVASMVKNACEKYGRVYYLCYDFSTGKMNNFADAVIKDFEKTVEQSIDLINSNRYLHHDGKPVIQLWGMGVNGNYKQSPEDSIDAIHYFKMRGFYVIGGTPTDWRKDSGDGIKGFADVYAEFDMISPWTVGRFGKPEEAVSHYKNKINPDLTFATERGQDFMPVVFAGFAWSLWNGGARNLIPRLSGEFMKKQLELARDLSPTAVYIAMFDEYDEGTAIMKAASDSSEIPADSYFLTTSADGTYVSSDYYLRLVGTFTHNFGTGASESLDIPKSAGPIWFKTGFEKDTDAKPLKSDAELMKVIETNKARNGKYAAHITGMGDSTITETNVDITENTVLTYYAYIEECPDKEVIGVAFTCSTRDFLVIEPDKTLLNQWQKVTCEIGKITEQTEDGVRAAFIGKTLSSLLISSTAWEGVSILIDDICLEDITQ